MKTFCIVTSSRADYGLLKNLIEKFLNDKEIKFHLFITGTHLAANFGKTIKEINLRNKKNIHKIYSGKIQNDDISVCKQLGNLINKFGMLYKKVYPDLIIVLGDRYEILSAVISALICKVPVAHIHGGELTLGAFDESIRHSISKMSHIHFPCTEIYKKRIIQLGENPKYIFNVGALAADSIKELKKISKKELAKDLNINLEKKTALVTVHPETLSEMSQSENIKELLIALETIKNMSIIFTMPNADPGNYVITSKIKTFVNKNKNSHLFDSLGHQRYLSCMAIVDVVIGNSSSGIIEAGFFKKPVINIGLRQFGRIQSINVLNCDFKSDEIKKAIKKAMSKRFLQKIQRMKNPYGKVGATFKIYNILKKIDLTNLKKKSFFDVKI